MAKPTRCPRCGRENDASFAFCLDCGQSLRGPAAPAATAATACASCGAALKPGFRFCGACGAPATPPAPTPRAAASSPPPLPRPPGGPAFRLTVVRHDGQPGAAFSLEGDEALCGRTEGEVRLADDSTVSPRHARFTKAGGVLRVEDLGSVNGTFLRLRAPRRVSVGEEIRIGRQLLRIEPLARPARPEGRGVHAWGTRDPGWVLRLSQLLEDGGLGEVFPLREGENLVGREAGEVAFPADRYVSARHARLDVQGGEITLSDAGSSNGTFVKIAGRTDLVPGDQILVGGQLLRVDA